ncbi:MAG TPA: glycoside hydrolase family 125 protein [Candidatus Gallacutalibacter stercoravium]|nr:glycoside hydrolase family 125 protein [Candidatus Gallacutalibacter stercoravium]
MAQQSFASVQEMITKVKDILKDDPKLGQMFENCFANTLNTTVKPMEDGTTFVITGDIPAMWLRDSVCQLRPYLILAQNDPAVADLIQGLIERQFRYIAADCYANAFNEEANGHGHQQDATDMKPFVWERKYEIDSLCFPLQFSYLFWKNTGRTAQFNETWRKGVEEILRVWRVEQAHEENSPYRFGRVNCPYTDTLSRDGKGALVKSNIGLTWSGFRPSDDACVYGYLVPSNMFACVVLGYLEEIAQTVLHDTDLAARAAALRKEIDDGISQYAVLDHEKYGKVYAYEVDGFGQYNVMDDANLPSLLSIPYIGYRSEDDTLYQNTRNMILSDTNPYYFSGKCAKGIGSPHTPERYIWHISLAMQGLTTSSKEAKRELLETLKNTDGGKGLMHEGFDVDDPTRYTREWFSWANAVFSELVLDYCGYRVKTK